MDSECELNGSNRNRAKLPFHYVCFRAGILGNHIVLCND